MESENKSIILKIRTSPRLEAYFKYSELWMSKFGANATNDPCLTSQAHACLITLSLLWVNATFSSSSKVSHLQNTAQIYIAAQQSRREFRRVSMLPETSGSEGLALFRLPLISFPWVITIFFAFLYWQCY